MFHRESGVFKTTYGADMALYPLPIAKWTVVALAALFVVIIPLAVHEYYLSILNLIFIAIVGALGLNILVGYTGQISIGHGAFMSVGAYTAANLAVKLGLPFWITLPAGGLMAALIGVIVGMPSLRIKGLYLAIATLAGQLIIEWTINRVPAISGGTQASIEVDRPSLFGVSFNTQGHLYFFLLFFAVLYTYYFGIANYEQFQLVVSIDYLAMIIIGGLGSVLGSILGAIFVTLLPIAIRIFMENVGSLFFTTAEMANVISGLRLGVFGGLIIFFLIVEPEGLNRLWRNIRSYFRVWPFSY